MNREIKFRKWDFEAEEMISGDTLAFEYYAPVTELLTQEGIMQYTGRKDRFSTDLYEGDIVTENDQLAVCVWMSEAGAFAFVPTKLYPCDLKTLIINHGTDNFFVNDPPEHFVTIVGNIHQHPHLLEVSE